MKTVFILGLGFSRDMLYIGSAPLDISVYIYVYVAYGYGKI